MLLLISGSWVQIEARFLLPFLKETADVWPNGQKFRQPLSCGVNVGGPQILRRKLPGFKFWTSWRFTHWKQTRRKHLQYIYVLKRTFWGALFPQKKHVRVSPLITSSGQRMTRKNPSVKKKNCPQAIEKQRKCWIHPWSLAVSLTLKSGARWSSP